MCATASKARHEGEIAPNSKRYSILCGARTLVVVHRHRESGARSTQPLARCHTIHSWAIAPEDAKSTDPNERQRGAMTAV